MTELQASIVTCCFESNSGKVILLQGASFRNLQANFFQHSFCCLVYIIGWYVGVYAVLAGLAAYRDGVRVTGLCQWPHLQ
jgi:hypothetical protein